MAKRLPRHPPGRPQGSKIPQNLTKMTPNDPQLVEKSTHQAIQLLIYSLGPRKASLEYANPVQLFILETLEYANPVSVVQ